MDWHFVGKSLLGVLYNSGNWLLALPTYTAAILSLLLFIFFGRSWDKWSEEMKEKRKTQLRIGIAIVVVTLLFVSLLLSAESLYRNKKGFAIPETLMQSYIHDQPFVLTEMVIGQDNVIKGRVIERCQMYGPCIVTFDSDTTVQNLHIWADRESFVIGTSNGNVEGLIWFKDCTIKDCDFYDIGWLVQADEREELKEFITYSSSDNWTMNKP